MSKGSTPRPFYVPREDYQSSYDRIFGKRERVRYVPPPIPVDNDKESGIIEHNSPHSR